MAALGVFWLLTSIVMAYVADQRTATGVSVALLGVGFCGLLIFAVKYWRCPACGHYFERGSDGRECRHCGTRFGA